MSRLQVGGLALIIKSGKDDKNVGKVVELIEYVGSAYDGGSEWYVGCPSGLHLISGKLGKFGYVESNRLMPLGDKQTQDELAKEEEYEPV